MSHGWKRIGAVGIFVVISAAPATAVLATTINPLPTTTTTAPPPPPALDASTTPCNPAPAGGPCSVDPAQLVVSLPVAGGPPAIQLSSATHPGTPAVVLETAYSQTCSVKQTPAAGHASYCWNWPQALTVLSGSRRWILNGTYVATACAALSASGSCTASSTYSPKDIGLAAPPASPQALKASQTSDNQVTLSWVPSASPEPDLVGYRIERGEQAVYSCSVQAGGSSALPSCPSNREYIDSPPAGSWVYSIASVRAGANTTSDVTSPPATAAIDVVHAGFPSTPATSGIPAGGDPISLAPVPVIEQPGTAATSPVPATPSVTTVQPVGTTATTSGSGVLNYRSTPANAQTEALGSEPKETGPSGGNLDSMAALALGLIALALAAHVWFLRSELKRFTARNTRMAHKRSASS